MSERTDEAVLTDIFAEFLYKLDEVMKDVSVGMLFMENDLARIENMLSGDKYLILMGITTKLAKDGEVVVTQHIKYRISLSKSRFGKAVTLLRFESISTSMKRILELGLQKKHRLDSLRREILDYSYGGPLTPQLVYQNLFRTELGAVKRDRAVSKSGAQSLGHVSKGNASTRVVEESERIAFSISDVQEYLNVLCMIGLMKRKGINYYPR